MSALFGLPIMLPSGADLTYAYTKQFVQGDFNVVVANAEFGFSPPGGFYVLPLTISFQIVTNATVANRFGLIQLKDNIANTVYMISGAVAQAAATFYFYTFAIDVTAFSPTNVSVSVCPLPPIPLLPGFDLLVVNDNAQAGDTLTALTMTALMVPSGPVNTPTPVAFIPPPPPILV